MMCRVFYLLISAHESRIHKLIHKAVFYLKRKKQSGEFHIILSIPTETIMPHFPLFHFDIQHVYDRIIINERRFDYILCQNG